MLILPLASTAIAICFSMSDAFRPEVLAAFMQQLVDEPVLPVLFMRTVDLTSSTPRSLPLSNYSPLPQQVIQAVTTYKTLQPFVSATLLPRLISKKVWETGPLWEGFIRCAKTISPHSFAALLLLPQEQLKDVVEKQPTLRAPLREYVKQSEFYTVERCSFNLAGGRSLIFHSALLRNGI